MSGYFGRVLSMAGAASPRPEAPPAARPEASAPASPPLATSGDQGFDPVAMGLEQETFVERPEAATPPIGGRERPAAGPARGEPGAPLPTLREPAALALAAPVPAPRLPAASTSAAAPGAPAVDRAGPPAASPRPTPTAAASDAPVTLEHEVLVEASVASATTAAAVVPARPADLLGQVRRWIATPPPARPARGAPASDAASESAIEQERLVAMPALPASTGAVRAASAVAIASPSASPARPAISAAAPPAPEPIDVHIGSIQVTVEDPTPARARRTTPERPAGAARSTFVRGWLQRRLVRS